MYYVFVGWEFEDDFIFFGYFGILVVSYCGYKFIVFEFDRGIYVFVGTAFDRIIIWIFMIK